MNMGLTFGVNRENQKSGQRSCPTYNGLVFGPGLVGGGCDFACHVRTPWSYLPSKGLLISKKHESNFCWLLPILKSGLMYGSMVVELNSQINKRLASQGTRDECMEWNSHFQSDVSSLLEGYGVYMSSR